MIERIYSWLHSRTSRIDERGQYSAGVWQDLVRQQALSWCAQVNGRALEIGCGEGLFLAQLKKNNPGLELWGVDNSSLRIEAASCRILGPEAHLAVGDAARLSFDEGFFDAAVCINVFFNMPGPDAVRKAILEMKRVTKTGGKIIFDFRNSSNPLLWLKYRLAPFYDRTVKDLPLRTYSLVRMEAILKDLGLEVVQKKPVAAAGLLPAPIIMIEARKT